MPSSVRLSVALAAVFGVSLAGSQADGAAPAARPVAFLHVDARIGCTRASSCTVLPPWVRSLRNPMDVVLLADGTLYYRARVIAVGRPGAGPRRCDKTLFARRFSGRCEVSDYGVGLVRKTSIPGPYKGSDIWVTSESALIGSGPAQMVNPFPPYPIDTGNPARPGHYTIDQFISAPGPGETLTVDVSKYVLS